MWANSLFSSIVTPKSHKTRNFDNKFECCSRVAQNSHIKENSLRLGELEANSLYFKGLLKYLLRPLLGKNQFAVTQCTYACIGLNLDNIH